MRRLILAFASIGVLACGESDGNDKNSSESPPVEDPDKTDKDPMETVKSKEIIPSTTESGIVEWLTDKPDYAEWSKAQTTVVTGESAHRSRTLSYFNDIAVEGLSENKATLDVGATIVKEMLDSSGDIVGHAVMIKTASGSDADTWTWYEGFTAQNYENGFYGAGLSTCTGCHASGTDYVRSTLPE